jgi:dephospho-CoA kinase
MKVVVVTGGIGSGKSVACRILQSQFGWPVYNADSKVKELYVSSPTLLTDIEDALEMKLRNADGEFIPSLLASRIFSDSGALEKVEELVFPELTSDFETWKKEQGNVDYVILESATILEKPALKGMWDILILIDAPIELRRARAAARDGVSEEIAGRRMESQKLMNEASKGMVIPDADVVILNDSTESILQEKLQKCVITKML